MSLISFFNSVAFVLFLLVFVVGFSTIGAVLTYVDTSGSAELFARVCGGLGAATNILQWTPQIIATLFYGHVGSLSIIMLALQVPGGLAVVVFNIFFVADPDITTWGPFLLSALQQLVLLIICIVLAIRDWRRGKTRQLLEVSADQDESDDEITQRLLASSEATHS